MNNQSIPYCNPSFILRNAARRTGFLPFTAKRTHDRTLDLSKAPSALTGTFPSRGRQRFPVRRTAAFSSNFKLSLPTNHHPLAASSQQKTAAPSMNDERTTTNGPSLTHPGRRRPWPRRPVWSRGAVRGISV